MRLELNGRPVYVELERNNDGSRFASGGYYEDGDFEELTDAELDKLQDECDDTINELWRGE